MHEHGVAQMAHLSAPLVSILFETEAHIDVMGVAPMIQSSEVCPINF